MLVCNARVLDNPMTGVPRYLREMLKRYGDRVELIRPYRPCSGMRGHLWEQLALPLRVGSRLLWSPSITGPLAVERQVVSIHDVVPLDHPEWLNPRFAAWYRFLTPRLAKRVRRILVISEFTKQRLVHHCPEAESKISVVHLAADQRFVPADEECISAMIRQLAIPSRHYVVALGSLEPRKNILGLLRAWDRIESKIPRDIWLVIAGAKGRALVFGDVSLDKLPPRVHLTGRVDDELLPALYSGAIASAYVSLYEGFGLPPLEAMACGAPVITSNVASLPEVVGDAALKVDPSDVESIEDGLLRLIEDSAMRSKFRALGLAQSAKFSWDKTASDTWAVLQAAT